MSTNNGYQFWFECGNVRFQLPLNPEKITVKKEADNETVGIADLGRITIFKERLPVTISLSGILPVSYFPGCNMKRFFSPTTYSVFFSQCLTNKKPVRFVVSKSALSSYVTVDSFQFREVGGDVGTFEYSLTLKEYRSVKPRKIDLSKSSVPKQTSSRVNAKDIPKTYTVIAGDCLWNIAKKFYGDGSLYTKIYDANKSVIGYNPNLIYPGQILNIP